VGSFCCLPAQPADWPACLQHQALGYACCLHCKLPHSTQPAGCAVWQSTPQHSLAAPGCCCRHAQVAHSAAAKSSRISERGAAASDTVTVLVSPYHHCHAGLGPGSYHQRNLSSVRATRGRGAIPYLLRVLLQLHHVAAGLVSTAHLHVWLCGSVPSSCCWSLRPHATNGKLMTSCSQPG